MTTGVIDDVDIEIFNGNPARSWTYKESDNNEVPDLYVTIEHEFGHFLGLLHAPCLPGFCEKFVMKTSGMTPRQLSTWDIAGVSNRYGVRTATIKHLKSTDGITWTTQPGFVSPDTSVSPLGSVAVACAPNGSLLRAIYIDTDGYLKSRWSTNRGASWSAVETVDYAGIGPHVDLSYGHFKFVATYQKYDLPSVRKTRFATVDNYASTWTLHGTALGEPAGSALTSTTVFPVNQAGNPNRRFGASWRLDLNRGRFFNTKTSADGVSWSSLFTAVSDVSESIAMACNASNYCLGVTAASGSSLFFADMNVTFAPDLTMNIGLPRIPSVFWFTASRPGLAVRNSKQHNNDGRFVTVFKETIDTGSFKNIVRLYSTGFSGGLPIWSSPSSIATTDGAPSVAYCGPLGEFWMLFIQ